MWRVVCVKCYPIDQTYYENTQIVNIGCTQVFQTQGRRDDVRLERDGERLGWSLGIQDWAASFKVGPIICIVKKRQVHVTRQQIDVPKISEELTYRRNAVRR